MTDRTDDFAGVDGEEGNRNSDHAEGHEVSTPPPPPRTPLLRRLFRSRTARAVTAAGVVGALLGAGTVAWRTDTLPLLGARPCWDSLGDSTMSALFGSQRTESDELPLQTVPTTETRAFGECRVTGFDDGRTIRQVMVRVHQLSSRGDTGRWTEQFLHAGMVSLGKDLPGMVSPTRAWLTLPRECTGRSLPATVVEVSSGVAGLENEPEREAKDRAALSAGVVDVANGVMRKVGCASSSYQAPEGARVPASWSKTGPSSVCGLKGFALTGPLRDRLRRTRIADKDGPARVCELDGSQSSAELRVTTVEDPGLTEIFAGNVSKSGRPFEGSKGIGSFSDARAVYRAKCRAGSVIFMMEITGRVDGSVYGAVRELFPAYVAAEAERIGCGPEKVTLPDDV